jgi:RES domain-containing protein
MLELKIEDLPLNWDAKPPIIETQFIGDDFVVAHDAAVLKVPSSIVPSEFNYLINPNHPDSTKISVTSKTLFEFDKRFNTN